MAKAFLDRVSNKAIGQLLIERGFISTEQCDEALAQARQSGVRLGETLLTMGYVSRDVLNYALGEQFGLQPVELHPSMVDASLVRRFPIDFLYRHLMLPLIEIGNEIVVVVSDPNDTGGLLEFASFVPAHQVSAQIADAEQVRRCLETIEPEVRHWGGHDPTPLPTDCDPEAVAAIPSEENFVRWLLTAAVQYPDSDLMIACSGEKAVVTRTRPDVDGSEQIHEFDGDLFATLRDTLLMQCEPISPARGLVAMLNSPLRFAGGLYALQVALFRHIAGEAIRLRPLVYPGNTETAPLPEAPVNGSEIPPPIPVQVILYKSVRALENYLSEYFHKQNRRRSVPLLLQNTTRLVFTQAVSHPGLFTDAPSLVMATGATAVVFDYPVGADMVLRVRSSDDPAPTVTVCARGDGEANPDILELLKLMNPVVTLLGEGDSPVVLTAQDALESFGGKA